MAINTKQQDFIMEYISNGFNAQQAYLVAYPNSTIKTAKTNAYRLLGNEEIKAEIERQVKMIFEEKYIKADRVIMEIADIAFAPKGDEDYPSPVKLKALELLMKHMGLMEKQEEVKEQVIEVKIVED